MSDSRSHDAEAPLDYDLQDTKKITVRVPRALIESADSAAEQQGHTRSEFVRDGIQLAIKLQDVDEAFDDVLARAVQSPTETESEAVPSETDTASETDVEFLKERIRTLESLLEDSIDKI
ncbi:MULTISPECIES: ribbon-helix-helix domain-containing protein [Natrialbaceae]|uniref:ribbon-helix-helix domain-containing protein n=1 Tax=Natrialbaceae TaxID=1644061 RepID=UPI00207D33DF|nr:ribbon-helix-helix domain-containing protein [Natronococcus sp. CG52]